MTNAEIIQAIRTEIERRKKALHSTLFNDEYNDFLSFLDSLESEKPMNPSGSSEIPNDLEEAADEYANKHYSEWDESWDDYNGHNVEPENDKLELMDAFIAGAKWISIHGNDIKEL